MSWTCPHCNEIVEEPSSGSIRFCLHCGQPSEPGTVSANMEVRDGPVRAAMIVFGLLWLVLFFLPYGRASFGMVMFWDLLANREGMSYLVSWPLMLSIIILVLGMVKFLGKGSVYPMVAAYCFYHFGKPWGEAASSIIGGYILGVISLYTKTIFGGLMIHVGIAWMMEIVAAIQKYWLADG